MEAVVMKIMMMVMKAENEARAHMGRYSFNTLLVRENARRFPSLWYVHTRL